ncbi:MAG: hypothetical protein ACOCUV_00350 [bacterium]
MAYTSRIYLLLAFLLFAPVLEINGHRIHITEFYLYLSFLINCRHFIKNQAAVIFLQYAILFFVMVIFVGLLNTQPPNNHDIFILRSCVQTSIVILLFSYYFNKARNSVVKRNQFERFFFRCLMITALPIFFVFLQKINIFNARDIIPALYKPQFHYLGKSVFSEFRYTAIFKDFFTAAVYSSVAGTIIYYYSLKNEVKGIIKLLSFGLLASVYAAQFFIARTSMLLLPFSWIMITIIAFRSYWLKYTKRLAFLLLLVIPLAWLTVNFNFSQYINLKWVMAGFSILTNDTPGSSTSFIVMQDWNTNFLDYLRNNAWVLIKPFHTYNLTMTSAPNLYTDSFYPQEIYRYGIYGIIIYAFLVISLLVYAIKRSWPLVWLIIMMAILNYKGGNVFMMEKNIYLYGFLFAILPIYQQYVQNEQSYNIERCGNA